jgi:rhodanese/phosphatase family RapZ-like protein
MSAIRYPRALDVPGVQLRVVSFGYGHGEDLPAADHTADVRDWFKDPHVSPELRELTGRDQAVIDNVLETEGVVDYLDGLYRLANTLRNLQVRTVTIAIGCVGGRHRSVVIAQQLADMAEGAGWTVQVEHLHVDRPVIRRRDEHAEPVDAIPTELVEAGVRGIESLAWSLSLHEMVLNGERADRALVYEVLKSALRGRLAVRLPHVVLDEDGLGAVDTANGRVVGYVDADGDVAVETDAVIYDGEGAVELAVALLAVTQAAAVRVGGGESDG